MIDYCGRRRECGTRGKQHEGGACNDLLIIVGAGENVVQEKSNLKAVLVNDLLIIVGAGENVVRREAT